MYKINLIIFKKNIKTILNCQKYHLSNKFLNFITKLCVFIIKITKISYHLI